MTIAWDIAGSEYQALKRRIAAVNDRAHPDGFLFWVQHTPCSSAWELWNLCPRLEWLLWIAALCGVPERRLKTLRARVDAWVAVRDAEDIRETPLIDGATLVRELMVWSECAGALMAGA